MIVLPLFIFLVEIVVSSIVSDCTIKRSDEPCDDANRFFTADPPPPQKKLFSCVREQIVLLEILIQYGNTTRCASVMLFRTS